MSDVRTARVTVDKDGDVEVPESVAEVVEEHRETLEIVAEGGTITTDADSPALPQVIERVNARGDRR